MKQLFGDRWRKIGNNNKNKFKKSQTFNNWENDIRLYKGTIYNSIDSGDSYECDGEDI